MIEVIKALGFMLLGGVAVHISWLHAWRMYREGRRENGSSAARRNA